MAGEAESVAWWEAVQRDGHRCRVAPFLPDVACGGDLGCYAPSGVLPDVGSAVTVCRGHAEWMAAHLGEARTLGLVSADFLVVETVPPRGA